MTIRREAHGRVNALASRLALALLTIVLMTAILGCGTKTSEQAAGSKGESGQPATVVAAAQEPTDRLAMSRPGGSIHQITLSQRGCVKFEPQWTSVRVGQAITWHSELRSPVRIYVSPGIFSRESYLVRPGATVSTGPARAPGRYSFWTEPTACRDVPRGVLLAGPGVRVQETFYASAPGVR